MSYNKSVDEGVEKYMSSLSITPDIKQKINRLRADIYGGPLYFDADGEFCSCFDEGAKQMDFPGVAAEVMDALDDVSSIWIETWSGCNDYATKEPDWDESDCQEWIHLESYEVLRVYLGDELYSTIR